MWSVFYNVVGGIAVAISAMGGSSDDFDGSIISQLSNLQDVAAEAPEVAEEVAEQSEELELPVSTEYVPDALAEELDAAYEGNLYAQDFFGWQDKFAWALGVSLTDYSQEKLESVESEEQLASAELSDEEFNSLLRDFTNEAMVAIQDAQTETKSELAVDAEPIVIESVQEEALPTEEVALETLPESPAEEVVAEEVALETLPELPAEEVVAEEVVAETPVEEKSKSILVDENETPAEEQIAEDSAEEAAEESESKNQMVAEDDSEMESEESQPEEAVEEDTVLAGLPGLPDLPVEAFEAPQPEEASQPEQVASQLSIGEIEAPVIVDEDVSAIVESASTETMPEAAESNEYTAEPEVPAFDSSSWIPEPTPTDSWEESDSSEKPAKKGPLDDFLNEFSKNITSEVLQESLGTN